MGLYVKSSYFYVVLLTMVLISGCTTATNQTSFGHEESRNSGKSMAADNTSEVLSVEALEDYIGKRDKSKLLKVLAKGSFVGDKHFNLRVVSDKSGNYSIIYTCMQSKPSNVSIWLKVDKSDHTSQMRRLTETEGCRLESIGEVSLPMSAFPEANQVLFIAESDTKITTIIRETERNSP